MRKIRIVPGEIYHVFNRSVDKKKIFLNSHDFNRFIELMRYYRYGSNGIRYSHFVRMDTIQKESILDKRAKELSPIVNIYAFCIMSNHFHLLLESVTQNGISVFLRLIQMSYAKYFNTRHERTGVLLQGIFRTVRIEDDEHFIHTHRYIHLNPVTSYIIEFDNLENYRWSSYPYFLNTLETGSFVDITKISMYFDSINDYKTFLSDQVGYQKELHRIQYALDELCV